MDKRKKLVGYLQTIPWFQELSDLHFEKLVEIAHLVEVEENSKLFSEGDQEDYLYIVIEGRLGIEIYHPERGRIRLFTAEHLDVVGWSSVTPVVRQRTASVVAVNNSLLVALDAKKLRILGDEDPELGYIIMRRMANIVAARLMICRMQLLDFYAHPHEGQKNGG